MHSRDTKPTSHRRVSRRPVLKAFGATALAAGIGGTTFGIARAGKSAEAAEEAADAIIVGAGYAGGTVARELSAQGLKPVILEARNRTGGRIWTSTFSGQTVEVGGGWVGADQTLIQKELARYNIATTPDIGADRMLLPGEQGFESMSVGDAIATMSPLWAEFYKGSEQYFERPLEPLYRKDLLKDVDGLSLAARLKQMTLTPAEFKRLNGETSAYSGGPSTIGALTGMAQWYQLSGGSYVGFLSQNLKPAGGMIALLDAMLKDAQADVRLQSPVTKITEAAGKVTVEVADGKRYTSRVVVVATPTNVWKKITFNPGLPTAHATATSQGIGIPHSNKLWLHVKGQVEALLAQGPEEGPISLMSPQQQLSDGRLFVAFANPSLNTDDPTAVRNAVRQFLPGSELIRYRAMNWGKDQYSAGGWGLRRPNQLLNLFPTIQEPHGRIVFAGADIAQGWNGAYIEGAVESGLRAAKQALTLAQ